MKNDVFHVIIDTLNSNSCDRKEAYSDINKNFGFLIGFKNLDSLSLRQEALKIVNIYNQDLSVSFVEEVVQFQKIIKTSPNDDISMSGLLKKFIKLSFGINISQCTCDFTNICLYAMYKCKW